MESRAGDDYSGCGELGELTAQWCLSNPGGGGGVTVPVGTDSVMDQSPASNKFLFC